MDLSDLNKVWEVKPLKMQRQAEATKILEGVVKQVEPIMRRRKWKVRVLSEFCPSNPSLLGLNIGGGAEIKLRLRRPNNELEFFPFEQILDTMLHELCHNEHGPHDDNFYKLWDEIRKECDELMAKGIAGTGKGFDLPGRKLGGYLSSRPPLSSLRQKALAAAEKRAQREILLPHGPKKLGGNTSIKSALSPVQAAAMAAERRLQDDLWCGSRSAGEEEVRSEISMVDSMPLIEQKEDGEWECSACTLFNQPICVSCEVCNTPRDGDPGGIEKLRVWGCKFCTLENRIEVERCICCGEWRYSYGDPLSARPPHLGT